MRCRSIFASLALAAAPALAQPGSGFEWKQNEAQAPADPSRASSNGFGVMMLITNDSKGFLEAWQGPTPPSLTTTDRVTRAKPVEAMLIFSGCRAAESGNCDVQVELSITGPDGAPYGEPLKGPLWQGPPAPQYNLQLGQSGLGFILEPEDKLGTYTLHAKVTDQVAGTTVAVQQAITAADS